jgi:NAD(P)-dependent dehydrogenase (short-subunit alcohol dehydrogenase family)
MHAMSKLPSLIYPSNPSSPFPPTSTPLLPTLSNPTTFRPLTAYPDSKLLLALLVRRLAQTIPSHEVLINHVCPGLVRTGLDRGLPMWLRPLVGVYRRVSGREVEEGARVIVWASVVVGGMQWEREQGKEGGVQNGHGGFVSDCLVRE